MKKRREGEKEIEIEGIIQSYLVRYVKISARTNGELDFYLFNMCVCVLQVANWLQTTQD